MNFTCNECNDTGSRDKLGTYLDCNACGTASMRRDLNDFVKSLGPTHPEDVALAIHQRALAMAPKQEGELRAAVRKMTQLLEAKEWPVAIISDDVDAQALEVEIACLVSSLAAPAAANGALPELPAPATLIVESDLGHRAYTADQMRAYGQACHALGRGAAVREYVENGTFKQPVAAAGPDAAQELIASLISLWDSKHLLADDYIEQMSAIEHQMRALSGAKGN